MSASSYWLFYLTLEPYSVEEAVDESMQHLMLFRIWFGVQQSLVYELVEISWW